MLFMGWNSDRTRERRIHTAVCMALAGLGLALSLATANVAFSLAAFTLATIGIMSRMAPFWAIPKTILSGAAAAAIIGSINAIGNLGGIGEQHGDVHAASLDNA